MLLSAGLEDGLAEEVIVHVDSDRPPVLPRDTNIHRQHVPQAEGKGCHRRQVGKTFSPFVIVSGRMHLSHY